MNNLIVYKQPSGNPWLDKTLTNFARDEISYVLDPIPQAYYRPHELFKWLCDNRAEHFLFEGLVNLAPLFPVDAYYGEISHWLAPPPSGAGNAVVIIMGRHDKKLRFMGGNYFNEFPNRCKVNVSNDFWQSIDGLKTDLAKHHYMRLYLQQNMNNDDDDFARQVTCKSNIANTMPVYLMLIDGNNHYFWAMPAIVYGHHPSDMKHEKMWEVA